MAKKPTHNEELLQRAWQMVRSDAVPFVQQYESLQQQLRKGDEPARQRLRAIRLSGLKATGQYRHMMLEAEELLRYFQKQKDAYYRAVCVNYVACGHAQQGQPDKALSLAMKAVEAAIHFQDEQLRIIAEHNLSDIFFFLGFHQQALNLLLLHKRKAQQQPTPLGVLIILSKMAGIHLSNGQLPQADAVLKEAEHILQTQNIAAPYPIIIYRDRVQWWLKKNEAAKALRLFEKHLLEPPAFPHVQAALPLLHAQCLLPLKKWKAAEQQLQQSLQVAKEKELHIIYHKALLTRAQLHLAQQQLPQAAQILQQAKAATRHSGSRKDELEWLRLMVQLCEAQKDTARAFQYLKQCLQCEQAMQQAEADIQLNALRLLSHEEFRQQELDELKNELAMKKEELQVSALYLKQQQAMLSELDKFMTELRQDNNRKRNLFKAVHDKIRTLQLQEADKQIIEEKINHQQQAYMARLKKKHPTLSHTEARVCALLRSGLSSKEISALLIIEVHTIEQHRYRIRKKMGIAKGDDLLQMLNEL